MKAIIACVILVCSQQIYSGGNSRRQHEAEVLSVKQRDVIAREQIAQEQNQIESLKIEIQTVRKELAEVLNEKYVITGYSEDMLNNCSSQLTDIEQKLEQLSSIGDIELFQYASQIDSLTTIINTYKGQKISRIGSVKVLLNICDLRLAKISTIMASTRQKTSDDQQKDQPLIPENTNNVEATKPSSFPDQVDVWVVRDVVGSSCESLYKIAGYPEVYGDSDKWSVLYKANQELIDENCRMFVKNRQNGTVVNPQDIIFPGQILKIPR